MRMLILGGGLMGRAAAHDMARQDDVERVVVADIDPTKLEETARFACSDKVKCIELDVRDHERVLPTMKEADAVLGAVSYAVNLNLSRLAIEAGSHFCDMGGNNRVVSAQLSLDASARASGVSIIPDTGLAPGMVSLLAVHGVQRMDEVENVHLRVGGLPRNPTGALKYALVFSAQGLINEYVEPCVAIRNGELVEDIEPLIDIEAIEFAAPFGTLEAFNTSGGTSTLPRTLMGKVRNLDYKTIRYPGHASQMRAMLELGLMSDDPIDVGGTRIAPRAVLRALIDASLPHGDDDVTLLRVTVDGTKNGRKARATCEMIDYKDPGSNLSAMMRGTAFPSSIIALMAARGQTPPGVTPQELAINGDLFIEEILRRGLPLEVEFESA